MKELKKDDVLLVLKALQADWVLVDDSADFDYLVGVSESRDTLEGFEPKKEFVKAMEDSGLIEDEDKTPIDDRKSSYQIKHGDKWITITESHPIVYLYKITQKGYEFLYKNEN